PRPKASPQSTRSTLSSQSKDGNLSRLASPWRERPGAIAAFCLETGKTVETGRPGRRSCLLRPGRLVSVMETCQGPKSRQIGGGSFTDEGTRVDCRVGSAPRIHAYGIGAYDAQGGDGEQCVAPAARLRRDVARSEIG